MEVLDWLDYLVGTQNIVNFLLLLSEAEYRFYEEPFEVSCQNYPGVGRVTMVYNFLETDSFQNLIESIQTSVQAEERIAIVCSSGQIRTAAVGALWIHNTYHISIKAAVDQVREFGLKLRVIRRPNVNDLFDIIGSRVSTPRSVWSTSATSDGITFITTGGTIDKDYPKIIGGYNFEIGNPAVLHLLEQLHQINAVGGFNHEIVSVCRKDSSELKVQDRLAIVEAIIQTSAIHIIITHGTDTLCDTADFIHMNLDPSILLQKRIIITGAVRPAAFSISDAPFNIGLALGAVWVCSAGIHIAINGRVLKVDSPGDVVRNLTTGLFEFKLKNPH